MAAQRILFLGPEGAPLAAWLQEQGEQVTRTAGKLSSGLVEDGAFTFLVSHGYRHIVPAEILGKLGGRAINLHISYLPWNRGADPNFWSFVDGTPKGVTIHYMDEGVDTGDIIVQSEVAFAQGETLASSYEKLQAALQELFKQNWRAIRDGVCPRRAQGGSGSMHRARDKEALSHLLPGGWATPVAVLERHAAASGRKAGT